MPALLPSELPVLRRTRQHWIVLFRAPKRITLIVVGLLVVGAALKPSPFVVLLILVLAVLIYLRVQEWQAEQIILTTKRVIRVQGVLETTSVEASLRVDRISGSQYIVTVPGKLLRYGTIALEAPGDHPGTKQLIRIAGARQFYEDLRELIYGTPPTVLADPDFGAVSYSDAGYADEPQYVTEPLPVVQPERDRFGRRLR